MKNRQNIKAVAASFAASFFRGGFAFAAGIPGSITIVPYDTYNTSSGSVDFIDTVAMFPAVVLYILQGVGFLLLLFSIIEFIGTFVSGTEQPERKYHAINSFVVGAALMTLRNLLVMAGVLIS